LSAVTTETTAFISDEVLAAAKKKKGKLIGLPELKD
jgi:hypothetical protein